MITRRYVLLAALFCAACKQPARAPATPAAVPKMPATVVAIRTTIRPANTTVARTIVIVGDRARDLSEKDSWRIFDTRERTVTTVDDVARTVRIEPLQSLAQRRTVATASTLPEHYPRVRVSRSGERRAILNINAEQIVIQSGRYHREVWIGEHPAIPAGLFAMMYASEPASSPLAPMMRNVDVELSDVKGFPLLDRSEIPLDGSSLVIEHSVVNVTTRAVPKNVLTVPKDYLDLTPKAAATKK